MSFPTVLIVDDSRLSRMMIRAFITQAYPDWTIIEASNGQEALEKTATPRSSSARASRYSAIIRATDPRVSR